MNLILLMDGGAGLERSLGRAAKDTHRFRLDSLAMPRDWQRFRNEDVPVLYRHYADLIEAHLLSMRGGHSRVVVIVDTSRTEINGVEDLSALKTTGNVAGPLFAMLVLTFPEVHWVWAGISPERLKPEGAEPAPLDGMAAHVLRVGSSLDSLLELLEEGYTPLFDLTGLTNAVRQQVLSPVGEPLLPTRSATAAALDEEENYAYFNAYVAYRVGARSMPVSTYRLASRLFGPQPEGARLSGAPGVWLTLEDQFLSFADKPDDVHLSTAADRLKHLPALSRDNVACRIPVTAGDGRQLNTPGEALRKPFSGMFALLAHLAHESGAGGAEAPGFRLCRQAVKSRHGEAAEHQGLGPAQAPHSAPGRLLLIADRLLARATAISREAASVPEAIYGTLLALNAEEYLGVLTPTRSLEALALRQRLEVRAECLFYGVAYNMEVKPRLREIHEHVEIIGKPFARATRALSKRNAEVRITSDLARVFREHDQFDEEQCCMAHLRDQLRSLRRERFSHYRDPVKALTSCVAWQGYCVRWYIDSLMKTTTRFVLAIVVWFFIFTLAFKYLCPDNGTHNLSHAILDATAAVVALQPPHQFSTYACFHGLPAVGFVGLPVVATIVGVLHLGIFISHLYASVNRR